MAGPNAGLDKHTLGFMAWHSPCHKAVAGGVGGGGLEMGLNFEEFLAPLVPTSKIEIFESAIFSRTRYKVNV